MERSGEKPPTLEIGRKDDFYLWFCLKIQLGPMIGIAACGAASFLFSNGYPTKLGSYQSLIGAIIYCICTFIDEETTIRGAKTINRFEQQTGITTPYQETALFTPKRPSRDSFFSLRERALNAAACTLSILQPTVGVGIGIMRLYSGLHNERVRAFHERKLAEVLNT